MKKFYLLGLATAALAAGVYVQGCGSSSTTDGGGNGCSSDTDCGTTGLCNTAIGQCMPKCTQGSDCSPTATCAVDHTSGTVCTCSINAQCGSGSVCNVADQACQVKCTSDANCSGYAGAARHCDTASGQCIGGTTTGDAGNPDSGNTTGSCDLSGAHNCPSGQYCNGTTCAQGTACTTVNTQDVCAAGEACFSGANAGSSGNICETISNPDPSATCVANPPAWTPSTEPTIWGITHTTIADPAGACATGQVLQYTGYWYDPSGTIPTGTYTGTGGSGSVYRAIVGFDANGNYTDANGSPLFSYYAASIDTNGTFSFQECSDNVGVKGVALVTGCTNANGCPSPLTFNSNVACLQ